MAKSSDQKNLEPKTRSDFQTNKHGSSGNAGTHKAGQMHMWRSQFARVEATCESNQAYQRLDHGASAYMAIISRHLRGEDDTARGSQLCPLGRRANQRLWWCFAIGVQAGGSLKIGGNWRAGERGDGYNTHNPQTEKKRSRRRDLERQYIYGGQ